MIEIFESYKSALQRLQEALEAEKTVLNRDASIQRFEFVFELAWKICKVFLKEQGFICRSPKKCMKEAFKFGLIKDDSAWLNMIEDRNLTAHTYKEKIAEAIFSRLSNYLEKFKELENSLDERI
ncbi:nucleotidyltransferase substrate binding protein [Candidatus Wolfebacteria bacterium]|nr:nucleotidyltransferase substrate binding protein [Candidatus Wolfebacteria bacterium]